MKIAPLMHALKDHSTIEALLVHTGQHYDEKMSHSFFEQLHISKPHINLEVGSASHAVQTARIMEGFETVCLEQKPDLVLVVGDVNSTAACSLVASKLHIGVAHYEAGLRSRDREMPEEINRLVTDAITDLYIT
ncbi:UDP-N-acetylglucosamine 2-epimerase, partial [bacterium]|nr:UDP-N-acetylglucosamine 2-epimerase [bacterium]